MAFSILLFVAYDNLCGDIKPATGPNPIINSFNNAVGKNTRIWCSKL